jgi:hypothetical protein
MAVYLWYLPVPWYFRCEKEQQIWQINFSNTTASHIYHSIPYTLRSSTVPVSLSCDVALWRTLRRQVSLAQSHHQSDRLWLRLTHNCSAEAMISYSPLCR